MALELNKDKALIFRITHRDNVPWILDNGMHARNGEKFDSRCRNIGNVELIDRRLRRAVPVQPYGALSDYVPFYFTPYSIMLFNIKTGHSVKQIPMDEIVIFVSSLPHILKNGGKFVFTNQHAYPLAAKYFNTVDNLDEIDWDLLNRKDFKHDPDDPAKKERYQAEALIWKHVPIPALLGVCCHSPATKERIGHEVERRNLAFNVAVQPNWYFE